MYDHYQQILQTYNLNFNDVLLIAGGILLFLQVVVLSGFCTRKEKKKAQASAHKK